MSSGADRFPRPARAVAASARLVLGLLAAVVVAGCLPASYQSEERILSVPSAGTLPLPISRDEYSVDLSTEPEVEEVEDVLTSLETGTPTSDGAELLRDAVMVDATTAALVKQHGIPDAIELHTVEFIRWFDIYYKNPPRTFVLQQDLYGFDFAAARPRSASTIMLQMNDVPRSVRRLALREGPLPPPWPVTIPPDRAPYFGVTTLGAPVPEKVAGEGWTSLSRSLASEMGASRAADAARARQWFEELARANQVPGLDWKLVAFDSSIATGFSTPDGTVFVSDALIAQLSDTQLAAILAHLMAHERYHHYADNVDLVEATRMAAPGRFPRLEVPSYPEALTEPPYGYTRWQEIEADHLAIQWLAKADIPPDALFDALAKLSTESAEPGNDEWPTFAEIHHLPRNVVDLGRLLDAGLIRDELQANVSAQESRTLAADVTLVRPTKRRRSRARHRRQKSPSESVESAPGK